MPDGTAFLLSSASLEGVGDALCAPGRFALVFISMTAFRAAAIALAVTLTIAGAVWVATGRAHVTAADPVRQEMNVRVMAGEGWSVTDQRTAPGVLVFGVEVEAKVRAEDVARRIVELVGAGSDEILMYFSRRGVPGAEPFERIQWLRSNGYSTLQF
jgi:hypothetical protein